MKGKKKHVLVISQYFYPEQFRINDICKEWVSRGYQVTVITGIPNYPTGKFFKGYGVFKRRKDCLEGVRIFRLPIIPRGRNAITLVLNYLSFVIAGFFWKTFTKMKADCVFIFEVSPMTQALPGIWFAKKRKVPCYLYVQDLWPENVEIVTGITNHKIIGGIGKMVDYIYKHCTHIFTTSNSFVTSIHQRGVPLEKLEYWPQYAEDFCQPFVEKADEGAEENFIRSAEHFQIMFTGNIGQAQGLDILLEVAKYLKANGLSQKYRFVIIGDGRYKSTLQEKVQEADVELMFSFIPQQPGEDIPRLLATGDVAFLCLTDSPLFTMTIPAKLQTYLACGMPILASVNGEAARIVVEAKAGMVSRPGNAKELADKIIQFSALHKDELRKMGEHSREYYEKHFDKDYLLRRMDIYLTGALKQG